MTVQRTELHVLQRKRIASRCDHHVISGLARVRENARKVVEGPVVELDDVVVLPGGIEVFNDVIAEVGGEHERIAPPLAKEHVVS